MVLFTFFAFAGCEKQGVVRISGEDVFLGLVDCAELLALFGTLIWQLLAASYSFLWLGRLCGACAKLPSLCGAGG